MTAPSTLCAPGYREVEPGAGPALRQGAAKLPTGQKLLGTPLPSRPKPKPEGLRGKLGEGTRVHSPVRSARKLTPSDPQTSVLPIPSLDATTHQLLATLRPPLSPSPPVFAGASRVTRGGGGDYSCTNTGGSLRPPQDLVPPPPPEPRGLSPSPGEELSGGVRPWIR